MQLKKPLCLLFIIFLLFSIGSFQTHAASQTWWNNQWSYREEIKIPFDTSLDEAKNQPIDTTIKFNNNCWAKNSEEHSIRVIYQCEEKLIELESQIYNLEFSDDYHISKCNLVFLIPNEANGHEKYFVYYDEEEKIRTNYPNHVQIEETFYRYEPIPGYPYESYCYKITEENYIVFAIAQKGEVLGIGTSQQVMKFKPKSENLIPRNGESIAFFDFWYYYDKGFDDYKSTCQKLVTKEIITDGNLMVYCKIISQSNQQDMQTTAYYKYYYNPSEDKKIHAHITHEVLKQGLIETYDFYDGSYVSLQAGGVRSNTIKELNAGEILPYIHIFSEDNIVREFPIYTDPEYSSGEWNIPITTTKDDVDLGSQAWACYDRGNDEEAYSLILGSTKVIKEGKEERDGIQLQIYETGYPDLPGLENNVASFQLGRNSYEKGTSHDKTIAKGLKVELDVEYFSPQKGGYNAVADEAKIFQNLIKIKPSFEKNDSHGDEEIITYTLRTNVFFAPSFPVGSVLSTLTGKNFSYITAEIYQNGNCVQSKITGRLSFNKMPEINDEKFFEKIKLFFRLFDFKNFTIFKKAIFPNIPPGNYLIKIYRNNPILSQGKEYIGYQFVNITKNTNTKIICTSEGKIQISVIDQNKNKIENVKILLLDGCNEVAEGFTDKNGEIILSAPCKILKKYNLKMIYKGFLIHEESVKLGIISSISPIKKLKKIELYDFKIGLLDTWGLIPDITLAPYLTSSKMTQKSNLFGKEISPGVFEFNNLIPEIYSFNLKHKSEDIQKPIIVPEEKEKTILFPLEYQVKPIVLDTHGNKLNDIKIEILRSNKKIDINVKSNDKISLPPGVYNFKIYNQNDLIGKRTVTILGDRPINFVTNSEPIYPLLILICGSLIFLIAFYIYFRNRDLKIFLQIIVIILLITSIVTPWWSQNGSTSDINTSTNLYIQPVQLVTLTTTTDKISGEVASLPKIFIDAISYVFILTIIGIILLAFTIFLDKYQKNKLSLIILIISFVLIITSILIFTVAMSELANITYKGFIGNGPIETTIIGEGYSEFIPSNWGPNLGFFIYLIAIFLLFPTLLIKIKNKYNKK